MTKEQQEIALHKKRFGQYFSGKMVADLLFSLLPEGRVWETVVDPMAGIGDMLIAVSEHTCGKPKMLGVEIDERIAIKCAERLPEATVKCKNAFDSQELITRDGWDLVITNPPYVRYQLQGGDESVMPSGREIREKLICQLDSIPYFSDTEKELFFSLAKCYSGLADMAVPAWILCAALVKRDGYLAIVVPETWLNRDYASPIQYLLHKCFKIEIIARDTNVSWFPEALVKTCLVVAKKQEMQPLQSLINQETKIMELNRSYFLKTITLFPHMLGGKGVEKWIMKEDYAFMGTNIELPHELLNLIGKRNDVKYTLLTDTGVDCGQGLRTGANEFFYVTIIKEDGDLYLIRSNSWDCGGQEYSIHNTKLIPALRNRNEVKGLVVKAKSLTMGVVCLLDEAEGDIKSYIGSAEKFRDKKGRRFKDYSAVKPNEKKDGGRIVRNWYMLPRLARRHMPNLCLTRVSSKAPECLYVEQSIGMPIAIDANMVTLWSSSERINRISMAVLNSTWSKLYLELTCTVMGGGALKIEASHLNKMLIPVLNENQLNQLEEAGRRLIESGDMVQEIQNQIDRILFSPYGDETIIQIARNLIVQKVNERSTRS